MPEDAPLELTNKILRGMRSFPALVGAGALSWLAPPTLVGTAFFLTGGTDLSREVLNSIEDVVLASLSIVLGTLVSTAVSVLSDRTGEDPVLHAPRGVAARHAGAAARQVVQVRQGAAQARDKRPRALRGGEAQIDPQVHGLRLPRLLLLDGSFYLARR